MRGARRKSAGAESVLGTLLTSTPLLVLEISRTGCLLESRRPIEAGAAGKLRLTIDGRTYSDVIRITRCRRVEGKGASYRLGAEFLRTRRLSPLRRAIYAMLDAYDAQMFVGEARVV